MSAFSKKLSVLRNEYSTRSLTKQEINHDPLKQFEKWFEEALEAEVREPNAFTLATVDSTNQPSARILLLKGLSKGGFTFFTNYLSKKARHIEHNPKAAMVFLWPEIERQVRVEGIIEKVSVEESDDYFMNRPMGSRLGAWASKQSEVIPDRNYLQNKMDEFSSKYHEGNIHRPEFWGGYRLMPGLIEFWQGRPNRLHDRIQFRLENESWCIERLSP